MLILFACRAYRLRDITLLRLGARSAGHRFRAMVLPYALPLLLCAALLRLSGLRVHLVISDKMLGDTWLARLFGSACARMLWNYPDEVPESRGHLPARKVCFFQEDGSQAESFVFAPQPQLPVARAGKRREIVFLGDVTTGCALPEGSDWWRERMLALREHHGFVFYLHADHERLIAGKLPGGPLRRQARVFSKNLLRLWIVQAARAEFGDRVVLVGSNWRHQGLESDASIYSEAARLEYFRSARVNLDCGSKSGDSVFYPRSSELISFAGGLLQVRCADTDDVYGERAREFSFAGAPELLELIERRLSESATARDDRDAWLIGHLGERRLLMQHSIDRMLGR